MTEKVKITEVLAPSEDGPVTFNGKPHKPVDWYIGGHANDPNTHTPDLETLLNPVSGAGF